MNVETRGRDQGLGVYCNEGPTNVCVLTVVHDSPGLSLFDDFFIVERMLPPQIVSHCRVNWLNGDDDEIAGI